MCISVWVIFWIWRDWKKYKIGETHKNQLFPYFISLISFLISKRKRILDRWFSFSLKFTKSILQKIEQVKSHFKDWVPMSISICQLKRKKINFDFFPLWIKFYKKSYYTLYIHCISIKILKLNFLKTIFSHVIMCVL